MSNLCNDRYNLMKFIPLHIHSLSPRFYLSHDMSFPTMWYVQPPKARTSLHVYAQSDQSICWSHEYSIYTKRLTKYQLEPLSLR